MNNKKDLIPQPLRDCMALSPLLYHFLFILLVLFILLQLSSHVPRQLPVGHAPVLFPHVGAALTCLHVLPPFLWIRRPLSRISPTVPSLYFCSFSGPRRPVPSSPRPLSGGFVSRFFSGHFFPGLVTVLRPAGIRADGVRLLYGFILRSHTLLSHVFRGSIFHCLIFRRLIFHCLVFCGSIFAGVR